MSSSGSSNLKEEMSLSMLAFFLLLAIGIAYLGQYVWVIELHVDPDTIVGRGDREDHAAGFLMGIFFIGVGRLWEFFLFPTIFQTLSEKVSGKKESPHLLQGGVAFISLGSLVAWHLFSAGKQWDVEMGIFSTEWSFVIFPIFWGVIFLFGHPSLSFLFPKE